MQDRTAATKTTTTIPCRPRGGVRCVPTWFVCLLLVVRRRICNVSAARLCLTGRRRDRQPFDDCVISRAVPRRHGHACVSYDTQSAASRLAAAVLRGGPMSSRRFITVRHIPHAGRTRPLRLSSRPFVRFGSPKVVRPLTIAACTAHDKDDVYRVSACTYPSAELARVPATQKPPREECHSSKSCTFIP